jgi:hypothetical protein
LAQPRGEGDVADGGVVELLDAGVVEADVVGGPAGAEFGALGGELADEVREVAVVTNKSRSLGSLSRLPAR